MTKEEYFTTAWINLKSRVRWLQENRPLSGECSELGFAIMEYMVELEDRIGMLEKAFQKSSKEGG